MNKKDYDMKLRDALMKGTGAAALQNERVWLKISGNIDKIEQERIIKERKSKRIKLALRLAAAFAVLAAVFFLTPAGTQVPPAAPETIALQATDPPGEALTSASETAALQATDPPDEALTSAPETAALQAAAQPGEAFTSLSSPILAYDGYYYYRIVLDAPNEPFLRYDAGTAAVINYTIKSLTDEASAKYSITYSGDNVTLLSPGEYRAGDPAGIHGFQFRVPESGEGEIDITLTAYLNNGEVHDPVNCSLFWSSCGRGVFVSVTSVWYAKLAMAKAQFDAGEITSADYYHIFRPRIVINDDNNSTSPPTVGGNYVTPVYLSYFDEYLCGLLGMLGQVCSPEIEHSRYAAPYVEAIHNQVFGIESDAELPDVEDVLDEIREHLKSEKTGG